MFKNDQDMKLASAGNWQYSRVQNVKQKGNEG